MARLTPLAVFLTIFFVAPFVVLFLYSFGSSTIFELKFGTSGANWSSALTDSFYRTLLVRSLVTGLVVGVVSVALAFPFAYAITLGPLRRHSEFFLFAVLVSLFSAYVVRIYAWRTLLGKSGLINEALGTVGLGPYDWLLFNRQAVVVTLVNVLIPMAVLPIYSALAQVDPALIEAARDSGAGTLRTLYSVTLPLASRGLNASFALCFLIAAGDYVTPQFVGGIDAQMLGNVIAEQFGVAFNWPLGSALAFMLVASMGVVVALWLGLMRLLGFRGPLR
ncbi:MAG: ABC transporter permease [Actinobacteria bacterium]|nr:ABC transporter permease [Actinomycetota bacterium]